MGMVRTAPSKSKEEIDFDFNMALNDCSLWPIDGKPTVTNLTGEVHLTPQRVELVDLKAKRGDADLATHGAIGWATRPPTVALVVDAKKPRAG